jgi:hypothetical protein
MNWLFTYFIVILLMGACIGGIEVAKSITLKTEWQPAPHDPYTMIPRKPEQLTLPQLPASTPTDASMNALS